MCIFWVTRLAIRNCAIIQIFVGQLGIYFGPVGVNLTAPCAAQPRFPVQHSRDFVCRTP